jgi:hypothetical protein
MVVTASSAARPLPSALVPRSLLVGALAAMLTFSFRCSTISFGSPGLDPDS